MWTNKDSNYEWGELRNVRDFREFEGMTDMNWKCKSTATTASKFGRLGPGLLFVDKPSQVKCYNTIVSLQDLEWLFDSGSGLDVICLSELDDYLDYMFESPRPYNVCTANGKITENTK